jgi:hypothetical protein
MLRRLDADMVLDQEQTGEDSQFIRKMMMPSCFEFKFKNIKFMWGEYLLACFDRQTLVVLQIHDIYLHTEQIEFKKKTVYTINDCIPDPIQEGETVLMHADKLKGYLLSSCFTLYCKKRTVKFTQVVKNKILYRGLQKLHDDFFPPSSP